MGLVRWTRPGGESVAISIVDPSWVASDYEVVDAFENQNRLREAFSLWDRTIIWGRREVLDRISDFRITVDEQGRGLRLWVYSRTWKGRGAFLAGILYGRLHGRPRSGRRFRVEA